MPKVFFVFMNLTAINAVLFFSIYMVSLLLAVAPSGAFSSLWSSLFSLLWVVPMYIITMLLGLQMWEEMYALSVECANIQSCSSKNAADSRLGINSNRTSGGSGGGGSGSTGAAVKPDSSFHAVSEMVIKLCVRTLFGVICIFLEALPWVGFPLSVIGQSWLDAFLCFEYRFNAQFYFDPVANRHRPLRLSVVLRRFEAMWPYYLGFSVTHVLARYLMDSRGVPYFINLVVCSVMFAVNVVTTVPARPGPEVPHELRLPIFTPLYALFVRCVPGGFLTANKAAMS
jgi:hypothetical protein